LARVERRRRLRSFAEWARQRKLVEHRHDAQFRGELFGIEVEIETGIRDSGLYGVEIGLGVATGRSPVVLRAHEDRGDSDLLLGSLRQILALGEGLRSIRIEPTTIFLRMDPGSAPDRVEAVIEGVLAAVRDALAHVGPYR
jgi:hypothetical protein